MRQFRAWPTDLAPHEFTVGKDTLTGKARQQGLAPLFGLDFCDLPLLNADNGFTTNLALTGQNASPCGRHTYFGGSGKSMKRFAVQLHLADVALAT